MSLSNLNQNSQCSPESVCNEGVKSNSARFERPKYRIYETETGYEGLVDIPGVSSSGVELSVEKGVLEISAKRDVGLDTDWKPYAGYREDSLVYRLRLALQEEIAVEGIQAKVENGVLRVNFPKEEGKRTRRITVN